MDATEQMLPAWNRVLKRYTSRQPMTLEEVRSYMGKTVEEIAAAALPTVPEEQRVAIFNQCCIEELPWLTEHPGTIYPQVPQVLRPAGTKPTFIYCQQLPGTDTSRPFCRFPVWATALSTSPVRA